MNPIDWLLTGLDINRWSVALAAAFLLAALAFVIRAPRSAQSAGEAFAEKHHVYVDPAHGPQFDRAFVRDRRRGLLLGIPPITLVVLTIPDNQAVLAALAPGLFMLSVAAENALRLRRIGSEFRNPQGTTGFARSRAVGVHDFVDKATFIAWCGASVVAASLVTGVAGAADRSGLTPVLVAHLVTTACFVLFVVGLPLYWQMIVSRPAQSQDAAHLYLQDAWRADLLLHTIRALLPMIMFAFTVTPDAPGFPLDLTGVAIGGLFAVIICIAYLDDTRSTHFRRRLWPMLGRDQVLMPGDVVSAPRLT